MSPSSRTRSLLAGAVLCALSASAAAAPAYKSPDYRKTRHIEVMIDAGRCKEAVEALKPMLKVKEPVALALAGSMYDAGVCVAPDWNRAVSLYMLADEAGNPSAVPHMVAGYAREGRDNGMALWWAAKSARAMFPAQCMPQADPEANPNGFNDELERMAPATFQACVYMVGVVAEVVSQVRYPRLALVNSISGKVKMEFSPMKGSITWNQDALDIQEGQRHGVVDLAKAELDNPRAIRNSLRDYLKAKGDFALSRYRRPAGGLDQDYVFKMDFGFSIE